MTRMTRLGSGQRFEQLEKKLSHRQGVYNPRGLAAYIGRKKYGKQKFQRLSVYGRRHHVGFDLRPLTDRERRHVVEDKFHTDGSRTIVFRSDASHHERVRIAKSFERSGNSVGLYSDGRLEVRPHPAGCMCPFHGSHTKKTLNVFKGIGKGPSPR